MTDIVAGASAFDHAAFEADVRELIKGSPLAALLEKGLTFNIRNWTGDIAEIKKLAAAIVASVQIVKTNLQEQHPNENWNHIAIETAAKILKDSVVLPGFWGKIEAFLLGPVLRGFLEGALGTFKVLAENKDWLALARAVLGLVALA